MPLRANGFSSLPWRLTAAVTGDHWSRLCHLVAVLAAYSIRIVYVNMVIVVCMMNILDYSEIKYSCYTMKHYSSLFRFGLVFYTDMLLIYHKNV
jgi:hypothetical protein